MSFCWLGPVETRWLCPGCCGFESAGRHSLFCFLLHRIAYLHLDCVLLLVGRIFCVEDVALDFERAFSECRVTRADKTPRQLRALLHDAHTTVRRCVRPEVCVVLPHTRSRAAEPRKELVQIRSERLDLVAVCPHRRETLTRSHVAIVEVSAQIAEVVVRARVRVVSAELRLICRAQALGPTPLELFLNVLIDIEHAFACVRRVWSPGERLVTARRCCRDNVNQPRVVVIRDVHAVFHRRGGRLPGCRAARHIVRHRRWWYMENARCDWLLAFYTCFSCGPGQFFVPCAMCFTDSDSQDRRSARS